MLGVTDLLQCSKPCEGGAQLAKKRLILHIGMHKTGTSSVQRFFSRNRMMLRRMGVCYPPSIGPDGRAQPKHNAIFAAISHEADFGAPHPSLGPAHRVIDRTADAIDAAPGQIGVISAEGLSGERPVFAKAMAPLAERFDLHIAIFLRRQDHWVESFYKQMVLNRDVRESRPFHSFVAAETTQAHMQYHQIINWWDQAIRPDRVHIFAAQPGGPQRPLIRLFHLAGIGHRFRWLPFANVHENPSPGIAAVEVVRHCNELGLDAPRHAAEQIEAKLGRGTGRYLADAERAELIAHHQNGNHYLKSRLAEDDFRRLSPNVAKLGVKNEQRWDGKISQQFLSNSMSIIGLSH